MTESTTVNFYDGVMGVGKTTYIIEYARSHATPLVIASPLLSEVEGRIAAETGFWTPRKDSPPKSAQLLEALRDGRNVVISHALLDHLDSKHHLALVQHGYKLILDEVKDSVLEPIGLKNDALRLLLRAEAIEVGEDSRIQWLESPTFTEYTELRDAALKDTAYAVDSTPAKAVAVADYALYAAFLEIDVYTYMAPFSLMWQYFQIAPRFGPFRFDVKHHEVRGGVDGLYISHAPPVYSGLPFAHLVEVDHSPKRDLMYTENLSLSATGYKGMRKPQFEALGSATRGFFKASEGFAGKLKRMYTVPKEQKEKIIPKEGKEVFDISHFVPVNARATNLHAKRTALAYLSDFHPHPSVIALLTQCGVEIGSRSPTQQSFYAGFSLSNMLQWIWRSAIRNGEPIRVYIPSPRMRALFRGWLEEGFPVPIHARPAAQYVPNALAA